MIIDEDTCRRLLFTPQLQKKDTSRQKAISSHKNCEQPFGLEQRDEATQTISFLQLFRNQHCQIISETCQANIQELQPRYWRVRCEQKPRMQNHVHTPQRARSKKPKSSSRRFCRAKPRSKKSLSFSVYMVDLDHMQNHLSKPWAKPKV